MNTKQEILLTKEDIISIENFANKYPSLQKEFITTWGNDFKTVIKISPKNGLLFIIGNEFTGFEHISLRHEFWSTNPFWLNNTQNQKNIVDPSRFKRNSIPIDDYIKIADDVYKTQNYNSEKNKRPDLFDYFVGKYIHQDQSVEHYILLTYKNSKVVHTLFPKTKVNNLKKLNKLNLNRGIVSSKESPLKSILEIKIPYVTNENITKYTILININTELNLANGKILIHDDFKEPIRFVKIFEKAPISFVSVERLMLTYQYSELIEYEKLILHIETIKDR